MKSDFLLSVGEEVIYIDIFSLFKSLLHEINSKIYYSGRIPT